MTERIGFRKVCCATSRTDTNSTNSECLANLRRPIGANQKLLSEGGIVFLRSTCAVINVTAFASTQSDCENADTKVCPTKKINPLPSSRISLLPRANSAHASFPLHREAVAQQVVRQEVITATQVDTGSKEETVIRITFASLSST